MNPLGTPSGTEHVKDITAPNGKIVKVYKGDMVEEGQVYNWEYNGTMGTIYETADGNWIDHSKNHLGASLEEAIQVVIQNN